jgi:hypothetical protein
MKAKTAPMAEERTTYVLTESTRVAIEKIATRAAEEILADPEFAAQLRAEVKRAVGGGDRSS